MTAAKEQGSAKLNKDVRMGEATRVVISPWLACVPNGTGSTCVLTHTDDQEATSDVGTT